MRVWTIAAAAALSLAGLSTGAQAQRTGAEGRELVRECVYQSYSPVLHLSCLLDRVWGGERLNDASVSRSVALTAGAFEAGAEQVQRYGSRESAAALRASVAEFRSRCAGGGCEGPQISYEQGLGVLLRNYRAADPQLVAADRAPR